MPNLTIEIDGVHHEVSPEVFNLVHTLNEANESKDNDLKEISGFVFDTLRALGVKDFNNLDNIGRTIMKEIPSLTFDMTMRKHKVNERFKHLHDAGAMLEKYKHLMPTE